MSRYSGIAVVLIIVALLVYGAAYWLAKPETLPIAKIVLMTKLNEQDAVHLQNVASQAVDGGFFSLNLKRFRKKIESLPWVESVSIRKKWPDTIQLTINERIAIARWATIDNEFKPPEENKLWNNKQLISNKGVVFEASLSARQLKNYLSYDLYMGPDGLAKKVLKNCLLIAKRLKQASLQLDVCGLDRRRAWSVKLKDGFKLRLGREKIEGITVQRIDDFVKVYNNTLNNYLMRIAHVDMRYTNGFTVGWKVATKTEMTQDQ